MWPCTIQISKLQDLLLRNMNSLAAVDIEYVHAMLSSIIPKVHNAKTEQTAIDTACRNFPVLKVANEHNHHYHRDGEREYGYSVKQKLPARAKQWVRISMAVIRARIQQCVTSKISIKPGRVWHRSSATSAFRFIESSALGRSLTHTLTLLTCTLTHSFIYSHIHAQIPLRIRDKN